MELQELIDKLESLDAIRGSFTPALLKIFLTFNFKGSDDIDKMDDKDLGTFFHEYVHFLQSLSTPWGLYYNMYRYRYITSYLGQFQEAKQNKVPFQYMLPDSLKQQRALINIGRGERYFSEQNKKSKIDTSKRIKLETKEQLINGRNRKIAMLYVTPVNGEEETHIVGADLIMESMAALYQELIDSSSKDTHKDMPYNFVRKYCEQNYPIVASDPRKLICCCYASLFSMCPGDELPKVLDFATSHPDYDGYLIFRHFMRNKKIKYYRPQKEDKTIGVIEFTDIVVRMFKKVLTIMLSPDAQLDYIEQVLERTKLSTGWMPIITTLYDQKPFGRSHIKTMIDYLGVPYTEVSTKVESNGKPIVTGTNTPTGFQKVTPSKDVEKLKEIFDLYNAIVTGKIN